MKLPRLEVISRDELYLIHSATLEVLWDVGVNVDHEEALKLLSRLGAIIDWKKKLVRIPEELVKEAIRKAPSQFLYYGRKARLRIGGDSVHFMDGGLPLKVLDLDGNIRSATLRDLVDFVKLYDALGSVDFIVGPVHPADVPEEVHHVYDYVTRFKNTTKPVTHGTYYNGSVEAEDLIEIASLLAGGREELRRKPILMGWENPLSPLGHIREQVDAMLVYFKLGLPVLIASAPQAGATSPVTLAGTLVQINSENLSSFVIALATSDPGRMPPLVYGVAPAIIDMRHGTMVYSGPEGALLNVGVAQLAKFYGLPSRGTAGCTESKLPDVQAGYESMLTLLAAASARINLIMNAAGGALAPGVDVFSFEKAVIDQEVVGMVKRVLEGIEVNEETLAVDVIRKVGPLGHFLGEKHTVDLVRKEHYLPAISDRRAVESWIKDRSGARERARETVKRILKEHRPEPLEPVIERELDALMKDIEKKRLTS